MHRKLMLGVLGLVLAALALPAGSQAAQNTVEVTAKLSGKNEVPGPGDKNGKGKITITLNAAKEKLCFTMRIRKLDGATAGHIHKGDAETAGPVKVTLFDSMIEGTGAYEGCVKGVSGKLINKIAKKPERFYVNIHNDEFPDGAIRGQLEGTQPNDQFSARLRGKFEVPGPGDPNGKGEAFVSVDLKKSKLCWQVSWVKIGTPTMAHIHKGAKGEAGPPVLNLFDGTPPSDIAEGCIRNVKERLLARIAKRPERFYVNVHTEEFPEGAIRGQLGPAL